MTEGREMTNPLDRFDPELADDLITWLNERTDEQTAWLHCLAVAAGLCPYPEMNRQMLDLIEAQAEAAA